MDSFLKIMNRKNFLRLLVFLCMLFPGLISFSQDATTASGDIMRSSGKIYVVMAICLTILAGFIFYVIRIDRKIKKLEDGK